MKDTEIEATLSRARFDRATIFEHLARSLELVSYVYERIRF